MSMGIRVWVCEYGYVSMVCESGYGSMGMLVWICDYGNVSVDI